MDPSPPVARKSKDVPFYSVPDHVPVAAKIIQEAKNSLTRTGLKSVNTRRPETPRDEQRKLFGEQSVRDPGNRPPSAFSLGSKHFDSESRPVSGTRLTPLEHRPRSSHTETEGPVAPKPPADPNRPIRRPPSRGRHLHQSVSVDGSQGDGLNRGRSGSLQDVGGASSTVQSIPSTPEKERRVNSGPKERTNTKRRTKDVTDKLENGLSSREGSAGSTREGSAGTREGSGGVRRENSAGQRESSAGSRKGSGTERVSSGGGRGGSAGRKEDESPEESTYYNTRVGPLVDEMSTHIKDKDHDRLLELSDELYIALEDGNMMGKNCKRRSLILRTVFKLLDLESPMLLLKLARLIFSLRVSGNNLINVCKLVFKVARDDKNDVHFLDGNILDLLVETIRTSDHNTCHEALIYCVGAIKFLTGTSTTVKYLVKRNVIEALARLLSAINKTNLETNKANEQLGHILVQLTAALRNVADVGATKREFLTHKVVDELCKVLEVYHHDADLMMNVSRIFSKITLQGECCAALSSKDVHFKSLLELLHKYKKREDLVVRLGFILGNVTAKSEDARVRLFCQHKAFDTILAALRYHLELDLKDEGSGKKTDDILVKLIRVIANLSISEENGPQIAAHDECVDLLINILDEKNLEKSEELVLNTMATINNLSYYTCKNSAVTRRQIPLTESLMKYIEIKHMEGLIEATRVFGNLSRDRSVRDYLTQQKVDEYMVFLLDSGDREVVFSACGVLINLMADEEKRVCLKKHDGIRKLIDVLRDFARQDWQLAGMVCQILWNYSGKITSTNACFGEKEGRELADLLEEYLDEEFALNPKYNPDYEEEMAEIVRENWMSDFHPVGADLLHRIENNQSKFEPL